MFKYRDSGLFKIIKKDYISQSITLNAKVKYSLFLLVLDTVNLRDFTAQTVLSSALSFFSALLSK